MRYSGDQALTQRRAEFGLTGIAFLFFVVSTLALSLQRGVIVPGDWVRLLAWTLCAVIGNEVIRRRLPNRDPFLFPLALFMSGWGLILIERLAPPFAERQTVWLIVSTIALIVVVYLPRVLFWMRAYRYTLLVFGLLLLVATILLGTNPSGMVGAPELWLGFGTFFFQPSEALKVILVAFLASYLAEQYPALRAFGIEQRRLSPRIFGPILLMWGLSVIILIWQRDLGTAILFFMVFLTLLYVASGYTPLLIGGALLVLIAGFFAYQYIPLVQLRIDIWLNPWVDADGRAYQIVQSLFAFGAGGIFGQGVGQGSPTFIPVVHSDFVFAALAEEWGFLGVIVCIACVMMFVLRGLRIAVMESTRPFNALLAVGLSILLAVQSLMIMGGVLKLIPLTGVTLPYFSYGGSSLLINFVMVGLLLRLSAGET
ncbi:MAG: FtsW/RodA/SpoVE family cell cycle protein [Anaerolinea sp.]|nr:FtsW/RodA/SpoVE family cell cycle protein [Anaerolinea sp.]